MISGKRGLTLRLELELEGDALSGQIIDPDGVGHPFTGRIGLVGAIEELLDSSGKDEPGALGSTARGSQGRGS